LLQERISSCRKWQEEHSVTPGFDWGTLPLAEQQLWAQYGCDEVVARRLPGADAADSSAEPEPPIKAPQRRRLVLRGDVQVDGGGGGGGGGGVDGASPAAVEGDQAGGRGGSAEAAGG